MAETVCTACGAALQRSAEGVCVACLLQLGAKVEPTFEIQERLRYFGDFELKEVLGRGGMGLVFRAWQLSLEREVALKMLNSGDLASQQMIQRFHREAEVASLLAHPNIVQIYGVGEREGHHFIVMELIPGKNLAQSLDRLRSDPRKACEIVAQVARAVHYAHQHGILHRDLKPANILLDEQLLPHLTDFGLAKILGEDWTQSNILMGTPPYMSPEQAANGAQALTTLSEIYSLGVILYEVLSGKLPYKGKTPFEWLRGLQESAVTPLRSIAPHLPAALDNICTKALQRNPEERYRTANEFAEDLEHWLIGKPIAARAESQLVTLRKWVQRNPRATFLFATVITALLVSVLLLLNLREQSRRVTHLIAAARDQLEMNLQKLWSDTNQTYQKITSENLSILAGLQDSAIAGARHVSVGAYENKGKLIETVENYAPLLNYLEKKMRQNGGEAVRLDLLLFKFNPDAREAFGRNEFDLGRFGANPYLLLRKKNPGVILLAKEANTHGGVIFVRTNSPIKRVEQLRACSIAFGEKSSTTSGTYGPAFLYDHGLRASDLKEFRWHRATPEAFAAVSSGRYDAGIAGKDSFARLNVPDLVLLAEFEASEPVWVGRKNLSAPFLESFRRAMLACPRGIVKGLIPDAAQTPFKAASEAEYDARIETEQKKEAFFHRSAGE